MRARALPALALAVLVLLAGAPSALAGGWALTSLDPLAGPPRASEVMRVGYTVLQHGVRPVAVSGTGIRLAGPGGVERLFPGRPQGPTGHYVAAVRFPAAGSWSWSAEQGWFGPQELGAVTVAGADAATPAAAATRGGFASAGLRWGLLAATLLAAAALAVPALLGLAACALGAATGAAWLTASRAEEPPPPRRSPRPSRRPRSSGPRAARAATSARATRTGPGPGAT